MAQKKKLLFEGNDWDFDTLRRTYDAIEEIALNDLGLDLYPNQLEIINSEQMLDAYSSIGMPLMYKHWSFGKHFLGHEHLYRKGQRGLAYEIVINSDPCVSYNMEENSMPLQTLVMAHAACGHNHFFKNNHMFREWTDADFILDYLAYAKRHVEECEEKYGPSAVEKILDAAHALMPHGVFRYKRKGAKTLRQEKAEQKKRLQAWEANLNYMDGHVLQPTQTRPLMKEEGAPTVFQAEENLLYFIEQHSPKLLPWQREILRIVRNIAQYFYPQKHAKVMNEGCASFVHYYITNELHRQGRINDGAMLEILHSHTNVITQPDFDDPRYNGINPYALGFAMMQDIKRICEEPTEEDREWFPDIAGHDDWRGVLKYAWANYRDDDFILQFLSPHLMRHFRFFHVRDYGPNHKHVCVKNIHDEAGYRQIRTQLAADHSLSRQEPDIQVTAADILEDRTLWLKHTPVNHIPLDETSKEKTLEYAQILWGYNVVLN